MSLFELGQRLEWFDRAWHGTVVDTVDAPGGHNGGGYVRLSVDEQGGLPYWVEVRYLRFFQE